MAGQREVRVSGDPPLSQQWYRKRCGGSQEIGVLGPAGRVARIAKRPDLPAGCQSARAGGAGGGTELRAPGRARPWSLRDRRDLGTTPQEAWSQAVETWKRLGGTHLAVNTMRSGLQSPD
jgi:hypothetical protein